MSISNLDLYKFHMPRKELQLESSSEHNTMEEDTVSLEM